MIKSTIKDINKLDKVTQFRITNMFFIGIAMNMLLPILIDLKGEYLATYIISIITIIEIVIIKTNKYMVNTYSIEQLYKTGVIIHIMFSLAPLLYFIEPIYFIFLQSLVGVLQVLIFSPLSILLTTYVAKYHFETISHYNILRNSLVADGTLIALSITAIVTYFWSINYIIYIFVIYNIGFSIRLLINWSFYDDNLIRDTKIKGKNEI